MVPEVWLPPESHRFAQLTKALWHTLNWTKSMNRNIGELDKLGVDLRDDTVGWMALRTLINSFLVPF